MYHLSPASSRPTIAELYDELYRGLAPGLTPMDRAVEELIEFLPDDVTTTAVADCGSGPGVNAVALGILGYQVTAVDVSSVAINMVREAAKGFGAEGNVTGVNADFNDWAIPSAGPAVQMFHGTMAVHLLHHYEQRDQLSMLYNLRARTLPGGHVLVVSYLSQGPVHQLPVPSAAHLPRSVDELIAMMREVGLSTRWQTVRTHRLPSCAVIARVDPWVCSPSTGRRGQ